MFFCKIENFSHEIFAKITLFPLHLTNKLFFLERLAPIIPIKALI